MTENQKKKKFKGPTVIIDGVEVSANPTRRSAKYGGNMIPVTMRKDKEEVKKQQVKGGINSGEARRKKQTMKSCMQMLLELPAFDKKVTKKLEAMGIDAEEVSNRMLLVNSLYKKAVDGDVNAAKEVRMLLGEIEASDVPDTNIEIKITRAKRNENDE